MPKLVRYSNVSNFHSKGKTAQRNIVPNNIQKTKTISIPPSESFEYEVKIVNRESPLPNPATRRNPVLDQLELLNKNFYSFPKQQYSCEYFFQILL